MRRQGFKTTPPAPEGSKNFKYNLGYGEQKVITFKILIRTISEYQKLTWLINILNNYLLIILITGLSFLTIFHL